MSRYIATRALRGANALVTEAEADAGESPGRARSGYSGCIPEYGILHAADLWDDRRCCGNARTIGTALDLARSLLHPVPSGRHWTPYLGETLDGGMATLVAAESYRSDPLYLRITTRTNARISSLLVEQLSRIRMAGMARTG